MQQPKLNGSDGNLEKEKGDLKSANQGNEKAQNKEEITELLPEKNTSIGKEDSMVSPSPEVEKTEPKKRKKSRKAAESSSPVANHTVKIEAGMAPSDVHECSDPAITKTKVPDNINTTGTFDPCGHSNDGSSFSSVES